MVKNTDKEWFSCRHVLSRGAMLNMVLSERGIGKTYNTGAETIKTCLNAVKNAIEQNRVIIWVRRSVIELDDMKGRFTDDIEHLFPNYEFKNQGTHVYVRNKIADIKLDEDDNEVEENKWRLLLELYSVKWFKKAKGNKISRFVKYIVFDEFIPEDGKYYGGNKEPEYFLNMCDSFIRDKEDCQIILLANAIQLFNPYFEFFDVMPDLVSEFTNFKKSKDLVIQLCPPGKYRSASNESGMSRFKNLIKDTSYAQTAITVEFRDNTKELLQEKSVNAIPLGVIQVDGLAISVWYDSQFGKVWYSSKTVSKLLPRYSFDETSESYASYRNISGTTMFDHMIKSREKNNYRFESAKVKATMLNKLKGTIFL